MDVYTNVYLHMYIYQFVCVCVCLWMVYLTAVYFSKTIVVVLIPAVDADYKDYSPSLWVAKETTTKINLLYLVLH